jgi:tetratricopeptide (TPR) repeat protein
LLGYCYLRKNNLGEAKVYFQNSLESDTTYKDSIVKVFNNLAKNALRIDEPERALSLYQEIAALVPEYDQANNLFLVGDLHFERGNYPAAMEAYTKALEIDSLSDKAKKARPKFVRALYECNILDQALELAVNEYEKLKTAANLLLLSEIRYKLGVKLYHDGLLDSAKTYFDSIITHRDPKSLIDDAYFYIGEIYYAQNNFTEALTAYKKVLRLNPYEKGDIIAETKKRIKEIKEQL